MRISRQVSNHYITKHLAHICVRVVIIFEAFSKNHINYISRNEKVGGPKDIAMLFSIDEIKSDFINFNFIEIAETEIELNEGQYHNGVGSVIRFVAQKK